MSEDKQETKYEALLRLAAECERLGIPDAAATLRREAALERSKELQ